MLAFLSRKIQQAWYDGHFLLWLLLPLSLLFLGVVRFRRQAYIDGKKTVVPSPCPVIVVGNINVGGSGKSPLVIWLAEKLKSEGYRPGIISRGYGGKAPSYPFLVDEDSSPSLVGDEPWMIQHRTGLPCVVDPDRPRGIRYLYETQSCDIIISDDGLQHYAMERDVEIVVLDGQRKLGNGFCLPAGPLREPASRLDSVDFVVVNGGPTSEQQYAMDLKANGFYALNGFSKGDSQKVSFEGSEEVHAVAGIGNPQRFFDTLTALGYRVDPHPFPDHYYFKAKDLDFDDENKIILTEKDAVNV
ncbi:MAG: tetraacyldisaccharide 4'-kinase [Pseudomonadales bacterium]|nr:tetraacyldisaccharide 4'-kinase [Pseudomonadales bacterium]